MPRLGLALSGGGFRATLFHLGVVRFLRDANLLKDVTHIVSVSGGSIFSAHLVLNWDRYTGTPEEFDSAAADIINFVQIDLRNRIARRIPFTIPMQLLQRLGLLKQTRLFSANGILEGYYQRYLFGKKAVHELPETPELHILATNVSEGSLCSFNRNGLLMQLRGRDDHNIESLPARLSKISMAVSASSAFPGFFPPVRITAEEVGLQEGQFPTQAFTDGGVYDNLGVRAFDWMKDLDPPLDEILVSDTGQKFRVRPKKPIGLIGQAMRASDILWDRVWQLELANFEKDPRFLFIPCTDLVDPKEDPTALNPVIQPEIQNIRTDLDRFSPLEIRALVGHGYCVARKRCKTNPDVFGTELPDSPPWNPIAPASSESGTAAEGAAMPAASEALSKNGNATADARAIQQSADRRIWSTLLDFRDWPTYVYIPLLLVIFVVLPYVFYQMYVQYRMSQLVIAAISGGDPEFHKIIELVEKGYPTIGKNTEVKDRKEPYEIDYSEFDFLESTRVIDLRRWTPEQPKAYAYSRSRIRKKSKDIDKIYFSFPVPNIKDYGLLLKPESMNPVAYKTEETSILTGIFAGSGKVWQAEFDLSSLPVGKAVDLTMELQGDLSKYEGKTSFVFRINQDTTVVNVWLLFPESKPYQKYQLLRYEPDNPGEGIVVESRFNIDHPYGYLIGWSMINPKKGQLYECQWVWKE